MSRDESTTKKRRLESEVSQSSGITNLSNITQTTELSSDFEDNNSDSSSTANQTEILYNRRPSATNVPKIKQIKNPRATRPKKQTMRKHRVSWSVDGADEPFDNDAVDNQENQVQQWEHNRYDNNFTGTNNSRIGRVRRATESSLDTNKLSFNKGQSILSKDAGMQQSNFQQKMRSNTTSQIYGHEQEIQSKFDGHQNVRSQCHAPLLNNRLYNKSDSHLYEPLHNTAQKRIAKNRPVETIVTIDPNSSNYLHPVAETKVRGNNSMKSENSSGFSGDGSSSYADVMQHSETSRERPRQQMCFDSCNNSLYRRGFYILLVFNVLIVLLNSAGLVYLALRPKEHVPESDVTGAQLSEMCLPVDNIHEKVRKILCDDSNINDGKCCFGSVETILQKYLKALDELARAPPTEKSARTPAFQVKADEKKQFDGNKKIIWESRNGINTLEATKNETTITVPKTGFYYVYSRVHYKKPSVKSSKGTQKEFSFGHTIMKIEKGGIGKDIDKVVQRCFPSNSTTLDTIHTNQLGSLHHLKQGDGLYVELHRTQHFVSQDTLFGMFMVAT